MTRSWQVMERRKREMNRTFVKLITIFCVLAIQGCIVDIDRRGPRPEPDIPCHNDWDCPHDSFCEFDGYCYEDPRHVECYHDFDCPMYAWCGLNGLCYEDTSGVECYTLHDCPVNYHCSNGVCLHRYR